MPQYIFRKNNKNYIKAITGNAIYYNFSTGYYATPSVSIADIYGNGTANGNGNSVNYNYGADWNGQDGNLTTVGTNGSPSPFGTYDQSGQVWEWNDDALLTARGVGGGSWLNSVGYIGSSFMGYSGAGPLFGNANVGFRIAANEYETSTLLNLVLIYYPNNASDTTGYGSVGYKYNIGKFPVTNTQYCQFLNLKALSDPYGLYNSNMGSNVRGGITRSGSSGSYSYTVKTNMGNKPVVYISWFDAARFCNWMHNNMGTGSTENGSYNLNGALSGVFYKNNGARFWIPTGNEWYKAAYYNPNKQYLIR